MTDAQGTGLTRRSLLQVAGATVAAYSLTTMLDGTARADDQPEVADRLVVFPIPAGVPTNASFSVQARTPNGQWTPVPVYLAKVEVIDEITGSGVIKSSSVATFDFNGTVEVAVTSSKGAIGSARIRPLSYGTQYTVNGDTVIFTLTEPRNLSIEINGEIFDNLQLHANPIEAKQPDPNDPDVIWFGPGIHTTADNVLTVPSGKTIYLAGGAVLKSRVDFSGVQNAKLLGRGVLWNSPGGVTAEYCSNIEVDGVLVLNPTGYAVTVGQSKQVTIRNIHCYSAVGWGDGIDVFSSEDVLIDGVWMRNSDDCVAVYAHRWNYMGDTRNVTVRNSVLWADVAHPVNIGTHGNTDSPEVIENLVFSDIDVLDHREPQMDYQGCFALNPGDSNLLRNVRIQDVRVEDFRCGQLINMRVMYNTKYNTSAGRGIDGVYVRNLSYNGTHANPSIMVGYDEDRPITNVTFQNVAINGTVMADTMKKPRWYQVSDFWPMYVNEHVHNLRFLDAATAASTDTPQITSGDAATATARQAFNHLITATALPTSFGADGLPTGLTVDAATGLISGTPQVPGGYTVTVSAANSAGTATQSLTLTVRHP